MKLFERFRVPSDDELRQYARQVFEAESTVRWFSVDGRVKRPFVSGLDGKRYPGVIYIDLIQRRADAQAGELSRKYEGKTFKIGGQVFEWSLMIRTNPNYEAKA